MTTSSKSPTAAWFQDAVFYKISVRTFFDCQGTGCGNLAGLIRKLDYIHDLGVDCIWLLPIFPSPLYDGGFDVTDYRNIHPAYGTIEDFRKLLAESHARGLRVVMELVLNHTSDEHPWFKAARAAPAGTPLRDFYVWSETANRFAAAHVSGRDGAHWDWDDQAQAFYWSRFSRRQPDLNYDNEAVRDEMLKVLRFWADLGVDGLCLNGAAYLAEREGTSCEHLPETHATLRWLRRHLAADYPNLTLQAGMNASPTDAVTYLGDHECDLAPCLPLAPRLFLALRQESAQPLTSFLRKLPSLPPRTQWVTLLRNHDELTLRQVSDDEQDFLYREYAREPKTRVRQGILRRLAPLVRNDRRQIELLFAVLFGLPGAPVIYYGDEIGMGDNPFLGGRDAVRTPMHWNGDRNGGFSQADFAALATPPVLDPIFGYPAVNVDRQQRDPSSLFHWMRRLIALRKKHPAFARGGLQLSASDNSHILAFLRTDPDECEGAYLVVANFASSAQAIELNLAEFSGLIPVELVSRSAFPPLSTAPYALTLAPHGFFWFRLQRTRAPTVSQLAAVEVGDAPSLPLLAWDGSVGNLLDGPTCGELESVLPDFLRAQRWFGGKAREVRAVRIADSAAVTAADLRAFNLILEVQFATGGREFYFVPLSFLEGEAAASAFQERRSSLVARLEQGPRQAILLDAAADQRYCEWLLDAIRGNETHRARQGLIRAENAAALAQLDPPGAAKPTPRLAAATSSNSLIIFGRRLLFKLFRRLECGINPDYEVGRFITEDAGFARSPPVGGKLEYLGEQNPAPCALGIVQALVPNQGDGWSEAIEELNRYYARASARMFAPDPAPREDRSFLELSAADPSPTVLETIGDYLQSAALLGQRTAEMHLALASDSSRPEFAPEPLAGDDFAAIRRELRFQAEQATVSIRGEIDRLPAELHPEANLFLERGCGAVAALLPEQDVMLAGLKTRIHGDYHLGQVLAADNDYVILDFEGEPTRSIEERRGKFSPFRDVAGMLRSYHYAAFAGLFTFTEDRPRDLPRLVVWADLWRQWVSAAFLARYLKTAAAGSFLPPESEQTARLLELLMISKALYELTYELNNRPTWVRIPLSGVTQLLRFTRESAV